MIDPTIEFWSTINWQGKNKRERESDKEHDTEEGGGGEDEVCKLET